MALALTLEQYLADHDAKYDVLSHGTTLSSMRTAEASHIPGDCLAKAILLKDEQGFLMAVLPATHRIRFRELEDQLQRRVGLATEDEIAALFADCTRGAVPPVGTAYGLEVIVDDSIAEQPEIYFEGGDHASLVHMSADQFARVMTGTQHGRFSRHG